MSLLHHDLARCPSRPLGARWYAAPTAGEPVPEPPAESTSSRCCHVASPAVAAHQTL